MLYYLKKYPISLTIIAVVIYLSFFKPPSLEVGKIVGIDKVAHICMYAGLSGMLWIEFLRNHRKYDDVLWHAWIGAVLCPVLMSGAIELLQEYCTTYRGGDWFDFLANICGVTLATLFSPSSLDDEKKDWYSLAYVPEECYFCIISKFRCLMTALELQERKNWALDILQACNSEEAISYMESLARKLIKIEKAELKRPNCFTLEEVKEMLKETNRDKENGIYVSEQEMRDFFQSFR